jgi:uncharacterized protein involved in exopolysaccharide biosynthesis
MYIVGAGILAASLISLAQPRWYRSEAALEIQGTNDNFLNTRDIYPTVASSADSSGIYVQTQAEILQQNALIEQVVKKLHLEARQDRAVAGESHYSNYLRRARPTGRGRCCQRVGTDFHRPEH